MRATLILFLVACGKALPGLPDAANPMLDAGTDDAGSDGGTTPEPQGDGGMQPDGGGAADAGQGGTVQLLTYNVAGLPGNLGSGNPDDNTPLISPKLNAYEIVLAQEDFAYHMELTSQTTHPYVHGPKPGSNGDLGDGLAMLSRRPLGTADHVKWNDCNGYFDAKNDCLTSKGFLYSTLELAPGVLVDLYNMHHDAGRDSGDAAAREKQVKQLIAYIDTHSVGRAVIIAGDSNMKETDEAQLQLLLTGAGFSDACRVLSCAEPYRIDRLMFRSSATVTLQATAWAVDLTFVDSMGQQLSDHEPVAITLRWSAH